SPTATIGAPSPPWRVRSHHAGGGGSGGRELSLRFMGNGLRLFHVPRRPATGARDRLGAAYGSGPDLDQMDRTFQGQSLVIAVARSAQSGEAEVCRGGGPRDRYVPEQ